MAPVDAGLWYAWRPSILTGAVWLYFDVGLGSGSPVESGTPEELAKAWKRLTVFRADVVIEYEARWLIVELRGHAGLSALGAISGYLALWREDPPDQRPVSGIVVTDFINDDMVRTARSMGVEVVAVKV